MPLRIWNASFYCCVWGYPCYFLLRCSSVSASVIDDGDAVERLCLMRYDCLLHTTAHNMRVAAPFPCSVFCPLDTALALCKFIRLKEINNRNIFSTMPLFFERHGLSFHYAELRHVEHSRKEPLMGTILVQGTTPKRVALGEEIGHTTGSIV